MLFECLCVFVIALSQRADEQPVSCGAFGIYAIGRELGVEAELSELCNRLPFVKEGSLLTEVMEASQVYGIELEIVKVDRQNPSLPNKSFLAYFHARGLNQVGHLRFVRPVEGSTAEFQVVDPGKGGSIVSENEIYRIEGFGYLILVPRDRSNCGAWLLVVLLAVLAIIGVYNLKRLGTTAIH